MLRTLRVRRLVIVEDLTVEFAPGLNLITGETGAGKSILVEALGLVAGRRADRSMLRAGADKAIVEALFEVGAGSPVQRWAVENGYEDLIEDGQLLVRRELPANGAGRVLINGSPGTLGLLREWTGRLLELHAQQEQRSLLLPENHLALLDRFGGHAEPLARTARAHGDVLRALRRRDDLRVAARQREQRLAELESAVREIDAVDPREGERDELDRERELLRNSSRVAELLEELVRLSYEGDPSAAGLAALAARGADELARLDPRLEESAERLRGAVVELQEVGAAFRDYRSRADFDPGRLEELEARRVALERLCLRYGADEARVLEHRDKALAELESLRRIDAELLRTEEELRAAERGYVEAAGALTAARREAGARLGPAVQEQLRSLALEKARWEVDLLPSRGEPVGDPGVPLHSRGAERAAFLLAANPGEPFAPLHKAASGGELSRAMLALHVVAESAGEDRVLVFDEVDAGVGGAVADAVGARLARLARRQQVLCVTHLPQVAAYGDRHLAVRKSVREGRTLARVDDLQGDARVAELARMLGGKRATPTSRRHASELLDAAGRVSRRAGPGRNP
jgi:DNA repair protein RecN (Recombination protein N)